MTLDSFNNKLNNHYNNSPVPHLYWNRANLMSITVR